MWLADKPNCLSESLTNEEVGEKPKDHSKSPPFEGGESLCELYVNESGKAAEGCALLALTDVRKTNLHRKFTARQQLEGHPVGDEKIDKNLHTLLSQELLPTNTFTQTFLQSILSSIDSQDQVVANAWMETLFDVIDLLPKEIVRGEILTVTVNKGQLSQPVSSRLLCCRMLGKLCTKFDSYVIRKELLPLVLSLCQDVDHEVRGCMCRQLDVVAKGIGLEATRNGILPELVELSNDEESSVRIAGIETVVKILPLLDDETCTQAIVPLIQKFCENAMRSEDLTLPIVAKQLGRLCHALQSNLALDQKLWFLKVFRNLAVFGLPHHRHEVTEPKFFTPMPDLVPELECKDRLRECRYACAYNFPAIAVFAGSNHFKEELHETFAELCSDPFLNVRKTIASGFCEVVKFLNQKAFIILPELVRLLIDDSVEVLKEIISNLPEILECVKVEEPFVKENIYGSDLVKALIICEESTSVCINWRLHAEFLTHMACLPRCLPPDIIYAQFVPLLFVKLHTARPIPCRLAASYSLLMLLRSTCKLEQRNGIINELIRDLCSGRSCHKRMLFLKMCEIVMDLFSKAFFKRHFVKPVLGLSEDPVPNIRLRLCAILPKLKSLMKLPKDGLLLENLESCVKKLMMDEKDRDVSAAVTKAIEELDKIEVPTEPASRRTSVDCEAYLEDLRKEEHERNLLEMELALENNGKGDFGSSTATKCQVRQAKIPVRKSGTLPKTSKAKEFKSSTLTRATISSARKSVKRSGRESVPIPKLHSSKKDNQINKFSSDNIRYSGSTSLGLALRPGASANQEPISRRSQPVASNPGKPIDRCPSPMPCRFTENFSKTLSLAVASQEHNSTALEQVASSQTCSLNVVPKTRFLDNVICTTKSSMGKPGTTLPFPEISRRSQVTSNSASRIPTPNVRN